MVPTSAGRAVSGAARAPRPGAPSGEGAPRVAVFSTNFLPASQTFVHEQLRHHARYRPEVFCWRRHHRERFEFAPVHQAGLLYGAVAYDRGFHRRFARVGFDVVHAHFGTGAIYARPYAQAHRAPLVVSFHGYDVALLTSRRRWSPAYWPYLFGARRMLEQMTLGLCASVDLRERLASFGVPERKLRLCRLGIDTGRWRPMPKTPGPLRILMVARLVEKKGHADALRAFALHRRSHPQATLRLVGAGPLRSRLARLAGRLGVGDGVKFLGERSWEGVRAELDRAHVILTPSRVARDGDRDSGLLVAKEASACGVVVVGTRHGGIPAIVDEQVTGLLADEGDVPTLARHLSALAADPERRTALGRAAVEKMTREYAIADSIRRLEDSYDEARWLAGGPRAGLSVDSSAPSGERRSSGGARHQERE